MELVTRPGLHQVHAQGPAEGMDETGDQGQQAPEVLAGPHPAMVVERKRFISRVKVFQR